MLALAALLVVIGGGNDERNGLGMPKVQMPLSSWGVEVPQMRNQEAGVLDVATPDRIYGRFDSGPDIRVAADGLVVVGQASEDKALGEAHPNDSAGHTSGAPPEGGIDGAFWADLSFYSCIGDSTGAYCPETSRTATGTIPRPGVAACDPGRLGQVLDVGGVILQCEDTGSAIYGNRIDRWFYYAEDGWAWLQRVGTRVMVEVIE